MAKQGEWRRNLEMLRRGGLEGKHVPMATFFYYPLWIAESELGIERIIPRNVRMHGRTDR